MKTKRKPFIILVTAMIFILIAACISACAQAHVHTYSEEWTSDSTYHWHVATCNDTNEVTEKAEHVYQNGECSVCHYPQPESAKKVYDMSGVVFENVTVTYDGEEHSIVAMNLPSGVSATYEGNGQINAGTYTVTAHFTGDSKNYQSIPDRTAMLTIEKAIYDMSGIVFTDETVTYDGQAHSITATNLPIGVTVTYEGNGQTTVGEYEITAKFTGDAINYEPIPDKKVKLTIVPLTLSGISFESKIFIYDGTPKSLYISGDLPNDITVSYEGNGQIAAGEYTITAKFTAPEHYGTLPNLTATLTITKATYDMSRVVFENDTVTYDGQEHSITATNLPEGVTVTYEGNGKVNAGTYTVTAHFTGDTVNHNSIPNKSVTLTISKATYDMSGVTFGDVTLEYDGQEHSLYITGNLPNSVTVTYDGNGQSAVGTHTITAHFTGDTVNYNPIPDKTATLTITQPSVNGITSAGGFDIDNTGEYPRLYGEVSYETRYIDLSNKITVTVNCTWKLFADFIGSNELVLKSMALDVGLNTAYIIVYAPNGNMTRYQVDIYRLDMKSYTFMNVGNEYDSGTIQEKSELAEPTAPERTGYTFLGWAVQGSSEIVQFPYTVMENITFVAQYSTVEYKITYHLNEGENDERNPESYDIETDTITLRPATRTGYTFEGWFVDEDLHSQITEIEVGSYGNKELYAKWEIITYTITYHLNGGENSVDNPESYNIEGDAITLLPATRNGAIFKGWFTDAQFQSKVTEIKHGSYGKLNLYAKWELITYTITYHLNEGKNAAENPTSYNIETETITLQPATREDYTFMGWYADAEFHTSITEIFTDSLVDFNLYAKWAYGTDGLIYSLSGEVYQVTGYSGTSNKIVIPTECDGFPVTSIGERAFYNRSGFTSVEIPNSVTSIGSSAFYGCSGLTSVEIPNSVTSIGSSAFYGCRGLTAVYITDIANWCKTTFEGYGSNPLSYAGNLYLNGKLVTEVTIPDGITAIGSYIFHGCTSLTKLHIPSGVTSMGSCTFASCTSLTSIVLPDTMTHIGHDAFWGCTGLKSVTLPQNIEDIGDSAFRNCTSLTSIVIPANVTYVSTYAFNDCTSLKEVYWNATNCTIAGVYDGNPESYVGASDCTIFKGCSALAFVSIGENVQTIPAYLFFKCSLLTSIVVPKRVTTINQYAFYYCTNLTIYAEAESQPDGWNSLWNTSDRPVVWGYGGSHGTTENGLRWALHKDGTVAIIGWSYLGITDLVIPEQIEGHSVTSISDRTFENKGITSIVIPDTVTEIGVYAFSRSSLKSITIGSGVTMIGEYVFYNCRFLTSVVIPNSVTSIGYAAFYNCGKLAGIVIPQSVTSIDYAAFSLCFSLRNVYYGGTAEQWNEICISNYNAYLTDASRYYYSDEAIYDGSHWHYGADGMPEIWVKDDE